MAESLLQVILTKTAPQKPVPPPARSAAPESPASPPAKSTASAPAPPPTIASAPEKPPEPPRAAVQFFPTTAPAFANRGTVADYFLRLQWVELQMAQDLHAGRGCNR